LFTLIAGGSWEDRQKYRKSKDSVQHWINTSLHDSIPEYADQISPFPSEGLSSSASRKESAHVSPNTNSCIQEHERNYEEYDTSRKFLSKEFKNVDFVSGMSNEDDTRDGFGEVVLITQEEEPTFQKRSAQQSLEDCSKIWDAKSERLVTNRKSSGSKRDMNLTQYFINCNKDSLSRNRTLFPADKGTSLPKKIILQNCDKSVILTNGKEQLATHRVCIPRRGTTVEISNNNSQTLRDKELATTDIKSTREQVMENYEKGPTAASDIDAGGEHRKNQISGYEAPVYNGEEVSKLREISKENVDNLCIRKGSQSTVKAVPAYRKRTLIQNDTGTQSEQKLLSGIEQNKQNSGMKEKSMLSYGRKKIIKNYDTEPTLRKDRFLFSGKEVAISKRKENETMRRTRLLFSDTETLTSEDTRDAEKYSKSPVSWKEKLVPSDINTTVSGAKRNMENYYTKPFRRTEDALLSKAEVTVGYSDGGQTVRENQLLTIDKQIILSTIQDKLSTEDKESLECVSVQVLDGGEMKETSAIGLLLANDEERDPVTGQECHKTNPVPISKQLHEQTAASQPVGSSTEIERQENLGSEYAGRHMSDEDCVEESLDDVSTVIIHPLLSCKYEHAVAEIRNKLKNLYEVLKDKDRGPLVIHDESKQIIDSQV
jgi:hypothetical protein